MHAQPPRMLTDRLSRTQTADVARWWAALPGAQRRGLRRLFRKDDARPAMRVVGRFVDPRERRDHADQPNHDFYEYLVNHELSLADGRTYHICSAHAEARDALVSGELPAAFRCPLARGDCLMRVVLDAAPAPGCSLRLSLKRPA